MDWFWSRYLADAARETCDPRLYLPRRERANWDAVPPAIVVTGHFDPVADEGDLYARHLHAKGVAVHAARRLEAHVQFAPRSTGSTGRSGRSSTEAPCRRAARKYHIVLSSLIFVVEPRAAYSIHERPQVAVARARGDDLPRQRRVRRTVGVRDRPARLLHQ